MNTSNYTPNPVDSDPSITTVKGLLFFGLLVSCIVIMAGCSNKGQKENNTASILATNDWGEEMTVDVPIAVNVSNSSTGCKESYLKYKVVDETDSAIIIDATSPYYDDYVSGKTFSASKCPYMDYIEYMEYLKVDLDIVNNTQSAIDVEELDVNVETSMLDSFPYVYVCTEDEKSNTISFYNASWFDWGGFTFSYSIMKKGEKFNGKYKKERHIDYFEDEYQVDLLPELIQMGYDFERVCRVTDQKYGLEFDEIGFRKRCSLPYKLDDEQDDIRDYITICYYTNAQDSIFYPFEKVIMYDEDTYVGIARLYGKIKFDNSNVEVHFVANVSLSVYCGFGAGSNEDDRFNVDLKTEGSKYKLRFPYTTLIEPYGAERITLIIRAKKSSNHVLHFALKNGNGLEIRSKKLQVHYMSPRGYMVDNGRCQD